jgi:hypothetical protein
LATAEPAVSALAFVFARAAALSKVISPLKSATASTSFTACACGDEADCTETLLESAPVRTIEPSAG